jgi:hypothetical protein
MCVTRVTEFWFAFSRCAATVRGVRCPCTRATPPPAPAAQQRRKGARPQSRHKIPPASPCMQLDACNYLCVKVSVQVLQAEELGDEEEVS